MTSASSSTNTSGASIPVQQVTLQEDRYQWLRKPVRTGRGPVPFYAHRVADFDPGVALRQLRSADPLLGELIDRVGPYGLTLQTTPSTFGALAEAIVYQQLHARAASAIFARVQALFADGVLTAEAAVELTDEALRGAGLSRAKLLSLRDLAHKTLEGTVPDLEAVEHLDDEQIIERFRHVRGIGRWTAQMFLIFRLGRPDVLPVDDYGIRKGFALTFGLPDLPPPAAIAEHGERWRPYRSVASWYLWRAVTG